MNKQIKKVVILGGGTAGWLTAALLKKILGASVSLELVESDQIGTVGVGEATIPPIRLVNQMLGIAEHDFIRETKATIKLAIRFENWFNRGEHYYHTFGAPGKSMAFCHFHHFWQRARALGYDSNLWEYDLNYLAAEAGKFAQINSKDPIIELPFAYHFDAGLYAQYLRKLSEAMGVVRHEGQVDSVHSHANGDIAHLTLIDGRDISADFFIDCSGFRALLIQQKLGVGYDDWSHLLPCDSALAVPSERHENTAPFTRSIAHKAGWQWRIPLQHRNGNGHVFCSRYMSTDEATHILMSNLDTEALGEPRLIQFTTGRRRKQWYKNVLSVGLSSGFLEPLESTSIHLIQSAIVRFAHLFPHNGVNQSAIHEYNQQSELEFTQIRDFLILHYVQNNRTGDTFWDHMRSLDVPDSLRHKMTLFSDTGKLFREANDLFLESSWLQVLMGQGIEPNDYHPIAESMNKQQLIDMLDSVRQIKKDPLKQLPTHDEYIQRMCQMVTR
ncbi:tryptophan halogenase family protein [Alteromonas facilis]|uniref:tryptophan halogenase family protein n=1 Tax=Alteromonas facilis TaxID=2048004 RepID=UPI000C288678|nr:tryptophan halogenase family protein [Alteromonas facilis]